MHVIYRKIDKLIAGHVYPRGSATATTAAIAVELTNVINSELGGVVRDYGVIEVPEEELPFWTEVDRNDPLNQRLIRLKAERNTGL